MEQRTLKALFAVSGNKCAFTGCDVALIEPGTPDDEAVVTAQVAHIVAQSRQGPRGSSDLPDERRDEASNLILLCARHHKIVDDQPRTYSVQALREMKTAHEARFVATPTRVEPTVSHRDELLHSTLLPVSALPAQMFSAICKYRGAAQVGQHVDYGLTKGGPVDFLLRDDRLYSFWNLSDAGPFQNVVDRATVEVLPARDLWVDPVRRLWYIELLNKGFTSHLRSQGLRYDRDHHRHYFLASSLGGTREVAYVSKAGIHRTRDAVREEHRRDGTGKGIWWHLAASFHFEQVADSQWFLTVRPGWHLTKDGQEPLEPKRIGRRITRRKSTTYNESLLNELQFWRFFLMQGQSRLVVRLGFQSLIVEGDYLSVDVRWPGIPGDLIRWDAPSEDNLFSYAQLRDALGEEPDTADLFAELA